MTAPVAGPRSRLTAHVTGARGRLVTHVTGAGAAGWLLGAGLQQAATGRSPAWLLGRATGVSCLLLLTWLVVSGMLLAHPRRTRRRRMTAPTRIRIHAALSAFCLALVLLHVVVLATDAWAHVGWWGALLPMASAYRPVPVTLGVLAAYSGLASGLTAALAGRAVGRAWWPLHKAAGVAWVLTWLHGVLAGSDTRTLLPLYLGCGAVVLTVAVSRYTARTAGDQAQELVQAGQHLTRSALALPVPCPDLPQPADGHRTSHQQHRIHLLEAQQ